jgi:hypothetical protein
LSQPVQIEKEKGDWGYLKGELIRRTQEPLKDVPFVIYFITSILLFGGLGIWVELVKLTLSKSQPDYASLITAISTFYPALIASSSLQLILASANKSDKIFISFGLFNLCFFGLSSILLGTFSKQYPVIVMLLAVVFSLLAAWIWWVTNCDDPTFKKIQKIDAATGGDPNRNLTGDYSGYDV